jgi:hypothetical protein
MTREIYISDHISYREATDSITARDRGIDNTPTTDILDNMRLIATEVFEPLRQAIGRAIGVSSFYRSRALNEALGGSVTSQHVTGEAIDLDGDKTGVSNAEIFHVIRSTLPFDQLIWEFGTDQSPDWVHVSYSRRGNRRQVLRSKRKKGRVVYEKFLM